MNTYSSRFDAYAGAPRGSSRSQEKAGLALFNGDKALCNQCHPSEPAADAGKALFTDFSYDNLGLPANPDFDGPPLGFDAVPDFGLGGFLAGRSVAEPGRGGDGAFKVPTLRNVAKTAPYGHNGVFRTLAEIVHFYNTRDVPGAGWNGVAGLPEVPRERERRRARQPRPHGRGGGRHRRLPAHAERQGRVRPLVGALA